MKFRNSVPYSLRKTKFMFGWLTIEGIATELAPVSDYEKLKARHGGEDGFLILDGVACEFSVDPFRKDRVFVGRYMGEVA